MPEVPLKHFFKCATHTSRVLTGYLVKKKGHFENFDETSLYVRGNWITRTRYHAAKTPHESTLRCNFEPPALAGSHLV